MKKYQQILKSSVVLLLCMQLFNICVYLPSWAFPGNKKADLTDSVVELIVEAVGQDNTIMCATGNTDNTSSSPTINEEILEDLHPPDEYKLDFSLLSHWEIGRNHYHFTPDLKTHVLSVVSPPPDFC